MDNPWNLDTITDPASTKQPTNTTQLASPGRGQTAFEFWWRAATVTLTRIRKTSGCHTAVTGSVRWLRRDAPVSHPLPRTTQLVCANSHLWNHDALRGWQHGLMGNCCWVQGMAS